MSRGRSRGFGFRRRARQPEPAPRRPRFVADLAIASGDELVGALRAHGLAPEDVVFKHHWPRYAPPPGSGLLVLHKSESLSLQFERLLALHAVVPGSVPAPLGTVRNPEGDFVGYLLERVDGETLASLLGRGALVESRRLLTAVERAVAKLHAASVPHGDLTAANLLAADDGRAILFDPVAGASESLLLQDELCLRELRALVDVDP
jgi:hypothetical protein